MCCGNICPRAWTISFFDCEHGAHDIDYYAPWYQCCRDHGIPTVTRVPDAAYPLISRAMDLGSDGIMVPRVESVDQVRIAVEAMHFPPCGKKAHSGKFQRYPGESFEEYRHRRLLWIQIESPLGAQALPDMLAAYGSFISACVIGPYDLSINCGVPAQFRHEKVNAVADDVFARCQSAGISSGIYANDEEAAARRIRQGANLLWMGCDALFMTQAIAQAARKVSRL